jgi:hypothetical protein
VERTETPKRTRRGWLGRRRNDTLPIDAMTDERMHTELDIIADRRAWDH